MPNFDESLLTLTEEQVITIHERMLQEEGGLPGLCTSKSLGGALGRIDHHIYYNGVTDLYEIAALYGISIAQGHIFNDANKRTAMGCMFTFLDMNKINLQVHPDEIPDFLVDIAEKKLDVKQIANWLKEHTAVL
jgi:death-on-curing protein